MAYTKTEKVIREQTKYHLFAFVKDSIDGPGHVSISAVKETPVKRKISHTSFFPGPLGSLINGLTFGSVPVKGQLAPDHLEDLEEAEHVLVKPIQEEAYKGAVKAQESFSRDVEEGTRFYSVFGSLNPLATLTTRFFTAHNNAHATVEKHKKKHGFHPVEDHCGIHVYDNDSHSTPVNLSTDNCTTSVTHVVVGAGIPLKNPQYRAFLLLSFRNMDLRK